MTITEFYLRPLGQLFPYKDLLLYKLTISYEIPDQFPDLLWQHNTISHIGVTVSTEYQLWLLNTAAAIMI